MINDVPSKGESYTPAGCEQVVTDWTPVYTKRLILRRPDMDDLHAANLIQLVSPGESVHSEQTLNSATTNFRAVREHWDLHGFGLWVVSVQHEPAAVVGFAGVFSAVVQGREALCLFHQYRRELWGTGYAQEGAHQAIRHADIHFPGSPVIAFTNAVNLEFQRTMMGVGLARHRALETHNEAQERIVLVKNW
jgi:RimJ/RimL family protein N-acetyltransferase